MAVRGIVAVATVPGHAADGVGSGFPFGRTTRDMSLIPAARAARRCAGVGRRGAGGGGQSAAAGGGMGKLFPIMATHWSGHTAGQSVPDARFRAAAAPPAA